MSDGIKQDRDGTWSWRVGGMAGKGIADKEKCARAYAEALIRKNPKYQPLVKGKAWPEVFKVLGIKV